MKLGGLQSHLFPEHGWLGLEKWLSEASATQMLPTGGAENAIIAGHGAKMGGAQNDTMGMLGGIIGGCFPAPILAYGSDHTVAN